MVVALGYQSCEGRANVALDDPSDHGDVVVVKGFAFQTPNDGHDAVERSLGVGVDGVLKLSRRDGHTVGAAREMLAIAAWVALSMASSSGVMGTWMRRGLFMARQ